MSVKITVPMVPPPAGELRRKYRHPQAYRRLRDSWQRTIYALVSVRDRLDLQFSADEGARARVSIVIEHRVLYKDRDNVFGSLKPVLDSLVNLGLIRDDRSSCIDLTVAQKQSPEMQTVIEISPITEDPTNAA